LDSRLSRSVSEWSAAVDLDQHIPIKSCAALQKRPVATIATFRPKMADTTNRKELTGLVEKYSYRCFPLVVNNKLEGLISRGAVLEGTEETVTPQPARTVSPNTPIKEAVNQMVTESADLLVLAAEQNGPPIGIVTLHDVLRAQAQITEQFLKRRERRERPDVVGDPGVDGVSRAAMVGFINL
jgi:chloride channel protein, CIC family